MVSSLTLLTTPIARSGMTGRIGTRVPRTDCSTLRWLVWMLSKIPSSGLGRSGKRQWLQTVTRSDLSFRLEPCRTAVSKPHSGPTNSASRTVGSRRTHVNRKANALHSVLRSDHSTGPTSHGKQVEMVLVISLRPLPIRTLGHLPPSRMLGFFHPSFQCTPPLA